MPENKEKHIEFQFFNVRAYVLILTDWASNDKSFANPIFFE